MSDATTALAAAQAAAASATTAGEAATGAAESVATALTHRNAASGFADAALDSAANADTSADLAAASETVATTKAAEASTSAANAAASATHAEDMAGAAEAVAVSNDTIIAGRVNDPASATSTALAATFAPKWKPSTAYAAGAVVQAPDGSIVKRLTSGTSGASYTSANWQTVATVAGTQAQTELAATFAPLNPKALVANLPTPFTIAHRGGPVLAPEESMSAYRIAVAQGVHAIEIDVQILADGSLVAMHDTTTTRTTTTTSNVADHTAASWSKLTINAASITGETGWPSEGPPFVEQILRAYGNRVCIVPQPYDTASMIALDNLIVSMGIDKRTILIQSFDTAGAAGTLAEARTRGYQTMKLYDVGTVPDAAALTALAAVGTKHACLDQAAVTSQFCTDAVAAGVRPSTFAPLDRTQRDKLLEFGVQGWFTDNPAWLMDATPTRTTDAFKAGSFLAGHAVTQGNRGAFTAPNEWGFTAGAVAAARLGYIKPPDPSNFTLTFDAKFTADGGLTSSAFYLFAMQTDFATLDGRPTQAGISLTGCNGYRFNADANSKLNTILLTNNAQASNVRLNDAATYALNTWASYKLTVTPTTLKWEQVGVAGPTVINHSTYRNLRYLLFGKSIQSAVNFRNIVVV